MKVIENRIDGEESRSKVATKRIIIIVRLIKEQEQEFPKRECGQEQGDE